MDDPSEIKESTDQSNGLPGDIIPMETNDIDDLLSSSSDQHLSIENLSITDNEEGCITRKSLGREAQIGALYNIRTDRFTGYNIFHSLFAEKTADEVFHNTLPLVSTGINEASHTSVILKENLIQEKLEALGVELDLALSIRSGLMYSRNEAVLESSFLKQTVDWLRPIKCSIVYELPRQMEQLSIFDEEVFPHIDRKQIAEASAATHVVIGIKRGTSVQLTINSGLDDDQSKDHIQKYLEKILSGSTQLDEIPEEFERKLLAKFYSNTIPIKESHDPPVLANLVEKFQMFKNGVIQNNEPLNYLLLPLKNLHSDMPELKLEERTWSEVPIALITPILESFNELAKKKQEFARFYSHYKKFQYCIPMEIRNQLAEGLKGFQKDIKSLKIKLADILYNYRNGLVDEMAVPNILLECAKVLEFISIFVDESIWQILGQKIEEIQGLIQLGVKYIDKPTSFNELAKKELTKTRRCVAFFCSWSNHLQDPNYKETMAYFKLLAKMKKLPLFFVDQDIYHGENLGENRLSYYRNGQCLQEDLHREMKIEKLLCIVMPQENQHIASTPPENTITLKLRCPSQNCNNKEKFWLCSKCRNLILYSFDGFFYCNCGKMPAKKFKFRCGDETHGENFSTFDSNVLKNELMKLKPRKQTNILILGETGVGKSTFINSFANYLSFPSMQHAKKFKPICLVPAHFTHNELVGDQYQDIPIRVGPSFDDYQAGKSCKAGTQSMVFEVINSDKNIRLIDTPGIGDTNGVEEDKKNFEEIMRFIENIDVLHGILILLPSNSARITTMFKYCIGELLTKLHKNAAKNIIFCFTNVSASDYGPGDTLKTLKTYLSEEIEKKRGIKLQTNANTIYCFENEAFRYLCCLYHKIELDNSRGKYDDSWEHTASESSRLINHISTLQPYMVRDSKAVNDVRRIIITLAKPLAHITANIQDNMLNLEQQMKEIENLTGREANLRELLLLPQISIESHELTYPTTKCTAACCIETRKIPNSNNVQTVFVTECHIHCFLDAKLAGVVPNPEIKSCVAIDDKTLNCLNCGCPWDVHMHMRTHQEEILTYVEDPGVKEQLEANKDRKAAILRAIHRFNEEIAQLKREQEIINKTCGGFAKYLDFHCLLPYNDAYEAYVNHLIEIERNLENYPQKEEKIEKLETIINEYQEHKNLIENAINDHQEVHLTNEGINQAIHDLFFLPIKGKQIKEFYDKEFSAQQKIYKQMEKKVRPPELHLPETDDEIMTLLKTHGSLYDNHSLAETAKKVYQSLSEWSTDRFELEKEM